MATDLRVDARCYTCTPFSFFKRTDDEAYDYAHKYN